jgi:hypothetical protein
MTAEAQWAAAGLRNTGYHLDFSEPLLDFNGTHEPLLIDIGSDRPLPELLLS